ncbi:MAG: division/cell wall cluster transcriptional repressor MraZ [Saprospiraceae bacterium]|nr:division/cell wall cluster transcriptional repressor MraZ [Saprospiraceae bacterium]
MQLMGEYECRLDPKGRLRLPSDLTHQLGDRENLSFVINRGLESCLMLYPEPVWDRISREVNQLNQYVKENREFVRFFHRGASRLELDGADRMLLPKRLLEWAGIDKDVILSAYNDRIEIWSKDQYDDLLDSEPATFSELAEKVLGGQNSTNPE